ncbi:DUF2950 family protein [Sinorhizobium numidicum]|uniref:DUF2950 family protein n=1 Tax=Sinorhizobium numidicum TaxID=680248 RepID=UPI003CC85C41
MTIAPLTKGPARPELIRALKFRSSLGRYFGYHYRILTGQGANVAGGRYDHVINGNMIGGFALSPRLGSGVVNAPAIACLETAEAVRSLILGFLMPDRHSPWTKLSDKLASIILSFGATARSGMLQAQL